MNKAFLVIIAFLLFVFGLIWTFNHINPWISFLGGAIALYLLLSVIFKK